MFNLKFTVMKNRKRSSKRRIRTYNISRGGIRL